MENSLRFAYKNSSSNKDYLEFLRRKHEKHIPLKASCFEKAYVVSDAITNTCNKGGVFNSNRNAIKQSFPRKSYKECEKLKNAANFDNAPFIDEEVVYLGNLRNHYGNFLVDSISRLWYAIKNPENHKYVVSLTMPSSGRTFHKNIYRFFELFGIKKEQIIVVENVVQFKNVIIPDLSLSPVGSEEVYFTKEFRQIISKVAKAAEPFNESYEKVYFSRAKFCKNSKTDFGEEAIVELMQTNDYKIIYPEECTLDMQIHFVNTCKVFASIGGSLAHNIIFSIIRDKKPTMYLFNRMNGYQFHQWLLNEICEVELDYIDMYSEPYRWFFKPSPSGPFLYKINKNVKRFAKDKNYVISKQKHVNNCKIFLKYSLRVLKVIGSKIKHKIHK